MSLCFDVFDVFDVFDDDDDVFDADDADDFFFKSELDPDFFDPLPASFPGLDPLPLPSWL